MKALEKWIVAISLISSIVAVGIFFYTGHLYRRPLLSDEKEMAKFTQEAEKFLNVKMVKLDKIVTNLRSRRITRPRYLNLEIHVVPFHEKQLSRLQELGPMVYDSILSTAGDSTPEELNSLAGKILFEDSVRRRINSQLEIPLVKKLFFSVFVIQ